MKVRALVFRTNAHVCLAALRCAVRLVHLPVRVAAKAISAMLLLQNPKMAKNKLDGDLDDYFKVTSTACCFSTVLLC